MMQAIKQVAKGVMKSHLIPLRAVPTVIPSVFRPSHQTTLFRSFSGCSEGNCGGGECSTSPDGNVSGNANIGGVGKPGGIVSAVNPSPYNAASYLPSFSSPRTKQNLDALSSLISNRKQGFSLERDFYSDPVTYAYDLKHIWRKTWLFAGYTCSIPREGDYFTYEIGNDSIVVMRQGPAGDSKDGSGGVKAFFNTCRHRGSRIVPPTNGQTRHTKRLVCPYHQWSYDRDGKLVHARDMDTASGGAGSFDKSSNGLHEIHVQEVEGLIFICLTPRQEKPMWDFAPARQLMKKQLAPHCLASRGKIAYSASYTIHANWKLVYENNRECYHCAGSHPEYIKSNYDLHLTYNKDANGAFARDLDPTYPNKEKVLKTIDEKTKEWQKLGIECSPDSSFPGDGWYRASRMPLHHGWVTESLDGQPVSTILGNFSQRDMGSFRIHTLPNYWIHLSSDHGVSSRLSPTGPYTTEARVEWIVDKDAIEGKDYHLDKMLPFWGNTSDQDWHLCEVNMAGVMSSAYTPGRLSERKEAGLDRFLNWYLRTLNKGVQQDLQQWQQQQKK